MPSQSQGEAVNLLYRIRRILVWSALEKPEITCTGNRRLRARVSRLVSSTAKSRPNGIGTSHPDPFTDAIILIDYARPYRCVDGSPSAKTLRRSTLASKRKCDFARLTTTVYYAQKVECAFLNLELISCNSLPMSSSLKPRARINS